MLVASCSKAVDSGSPVGHVLGFAERANDVAERTERLIDVLRLHGDGILGVLTRRNLQLAEQGHCCDHRQPGHRTSVSMCFLALVLDRRSLPARSMRLSLAVVMVPLATSTAYFIACMHVCVCVCVCVCVIEHEHMPVSPRGCAVRAWQYMVKIKCERDEVALASCPAVCRMRDPRASSCCTSASFST